MYISRNPILVIHFVSFDMGFADWHKSPAVPHPPGYHNLQLQWYVRGLCAGLGDELTRWAHKNGSYGSAMHTILRELRGLDNGRSLWHTSILGTYWDSCNPVHARSQCHSQRYHFEGLPLSVSSVFSPISLLLAGSWVPWMPEETAGAPFSKIFYLVPIQI